MFLFPCAGLLSYGTQKASKENDQKGFEPAQKAVPLDLRWSLCYISDREIAVASLYCQKSILPSRGCPVRSRTQNPREEEPFPTWFQASRPRPAQTGGLVGFRAVELDPLGPAVSFVLQEEETSLAAAAELQPFLTGPPLQPGEHFQWMDVLPPGSTHEGQHTEHSSLL